MKSILLTIITMCTCICCLGQHSFFVKENYATSPLIKRKLREASQQIAPSMLRSDYTITTAIEPKPDTNSLVFTIELSDSLTNRTVYYNKQSYAIPAVSHDQKLAMNFALYFFIDKHMRAALACVKNQPQRM